jgi:DDE family transposase
MRSASRFLFGIYDITKNAGYVTVGISNNTSEFAVAGQPLRSLEVMLAFIRGTTTVSGLAVEAQLDQEIYRKVEKLQSANYQPSHALPTIFVPAGTTRFPRATKM